MARENRWDGAGVAYRPAEGPSTESPPCLLNPSTQRRRTAGRSRQGRGHRREIRVEAGEAKQLRVAFPCSPGALSSRGGGGGGGIRAPKRTIHSCCRAVSTLPNQGRNLHGARLPTAQVRPACGRPTTGSGHARTMNCQRRCKGHHPAHTLPDGTQRRAQSRPCPRQEVGRQGVRRNVVHECGNVRSLFQMPRTMHWLQRCLTTIRARRPPAV